VCYPVKCSVCGKTTWAGCGQHVEAVKRTVPASQWCPGHQGEESSSPSGGGFFARLFSR
jgi:hypothetical protein